MIISNIFPQGTQEVLNFLSDGHILEKPYQKSVSSDRIIKDPKAAMAIYMDQDVSPPKYFLPDITSGAEGAIPPADGEQEALDVALIEYEEQVNFYQKVLSKIKFLKNEYLMSDHEISVMADTIGSYLYHCARSRLLLPQGHPYFEKIFSILKDQGFPCGWLGGNSWEAGDFLIFSR